MQLDLLLRSFFRYVAPSPIMPTVLYSASDVAYERQYTEIARVYEGKVALVKEEDFRLQVLELLKPPGSQRGTPGLGRVSKLFRLRNGESRENGAADCLLFLVDDAVFVRGCDIRQAAIVLNAAHKAIGYSFRLGRNTGRSYVLGRAQQLPRFEAADRNVLRYRWRGADGDFGYPLEISSSLYRVQLISDLLRRIPFTNPNTLESGLSLEAPRLARRHPYLLCAPVSSAFSIPANRVQGVFENRSGNDPGLSTKRLATAFEQGLQIDLAPLADFVPASAHQEMSFSFETAVGRS